MKNNKLSSFKINFVIEDKFSLNLIVKIWIETDVIFIDISMLKTHKNVWKMLMQ